MGDLSCMLEVNLLVDTTLNAFINADSTNNVIMQQEMDITFASLDVSLKHRIDGAVKRPAY